MRRTGKGLFLLLITAIGALLAAVACGDSLTPLPPKSDPAAFTKAFVQQAIDRYDRDGRADTIDYYNTTESMDGQWYVFIIDEAEILVSHPTMPELRGTNGRETRGPDGFPVGLLNLSVANENGAWSSYVFNSPGSGAPEFKRSWLVRHDGLLFGSGWYEPAPSKSDPAAYTQAFVQRAADFYDAVGRGPTLEYYNNPESVDEEWYVFISDLAGDLVAHAAFPEYVGDNILGPLGTDSTGYVFGPQILAATEEGGWVDYAFRNPTTEQEGTKHSWVVKRGDLIFGAGWYEPGPSKSDPAAYTQAFVQQAIDRYERDGRADTIDYYNTAESVDGHWYVFIIDEANIIVSHATIPDLRGVDARNVRGQNNFPIGLQGLAKANETGDWYSYVFTNPGSGEVELKHVWGKRHDGLIFGSGWYEPAPSKSDPAAYTQAFVKRATDFYDAVGRDVTLDYYNTPESVDEEWYVFILDLDGVLVAQPAFPEYVGDNILGPLGTDSTGYVFGPQILAATEEGGWVDYAFRNPTTEQEGTKHSWVIKRGDLIFGAGWYEPGPSKSDPAAYTQAFVQQAIDRYERDGRTAAIDYYNTTESVDGHWYVFIIDEANIIVSHATIPDLRGVDARNVRGQNNFPIGLQGLAKANETGDWYSYVFTNPGSGEVELKHVWGKRHDGLIFGSGWYEPAPSKSDPAAYTQAFVQRAADLYDAVGREVTLDYYNTPESVDEEWYVFILDLGGVLVAQPAFPEYVGDNILGPLGTDSTGYVFGPQILAATEEGGWVDYAFRNPTTEQEGTKHSWVIKRGDLIFGAGWYEPAP